MILNLFFIFRLYLKRLTKDPGFVTILALSLLIAFLYTNVSASMPEVKYFIDYNLFCLICLTSILIYNLNIFNIFNLYFPKTMDVLFLVAFLNLSPAIPILLLIFITGDLIKFVIATLSLYSVSLLISNGPKFFSILPLAIYLSLHFMSLYQETIILIFTCLPPAVLLILLSANIRPIFLGGLLIFYRHALLISTFLILYAISSPSSYSGYLTVFGAGIINPDFSNPLSILLLTSSQLLLILLTFMSLAFSRSADYQLSDLRYLFGTFIRRRVIAIITALSVAIAFVIPSYFALTLRGVMDIDVLFMIHCCFTAVFANLLIPATPQSSRLVLSLFIFFLLVMNFSIFLDILLLTLLVVAYDVDVKLSFLWRDLKWKIA